MSHKKGSFGSVQAGLRAHINATAKTAADSAIPQDQGVQESGSVPSGKSDAEVNDMIPSGGSVPAEPKKDLVSERGVDALEKSPDQFSPSTEEKERKEVSPSAKLAAAKDRLMKSVKLAAQ